LHPWCVCVCVRVCVCVCVCVKVWCKTGQTRVDYKVASTLASARMRGRVWTVVNACDELKPADHIAFNTGALYYYQHAIVLRVDGICFAYLLIYLFVYWAHSWGHSGPLCHALSLSSSLSGVVVDIDAQATPGEWACGGSQ